MQLVAFSGCFKFVQDLCSFFGGSCTPYKVRYLPTNRNCTIIAAKPEILRLPEG